MTRSAVSDPVVVVSNDTHIGLLDEDLRPTAPPAASTSSTGSRQRR